MKYYLIAGEASGDLHAANLMKSILKLDKEADFRFWGGDKMQSVGGSMVEHYRNMAFMGFIEVIKNIWTILSFIKKCKKDIQQYQPDIIILVDYPGFNLRIAKWAKKENFKIAYYITPQVWAWHKNRVYDLGRYTDLLLVILPFEADFFKKYGFTATFVGHPLLDALDDFAPDKQFLDEFNLKKPIIALLPGSRKQEISSILPIMLEGIKNTNHQVVLAGAPSIEPVFYHKILADSHYTEKITIIHNQTYDLLSNSDLALVSSGTATLETALFRVPQIVCYKGSPLSYAIAKRLIDLKYISLVNIIADKQIVKELIQYDLTAENIRNELDLLMKDSTKIRNEYELLREALGVKGASDRTANYIFNFLRTP